MKISLEWLNEYVDLTGLSAGEISHALTMVGFEVEGIEQAGLPPLEHVVVGEIVSFEQHPNADRLSVCEVDVGDGTPRTIVCGAKNFRTRDRVLAALPGAVLPGDFKIKKSKLRGVVSEGMLCSERELGIGDDHAGIAILDTRPEVGTLVNAVYPEPDTVFDVEITPNRPDALSHLGIARELAAWFKRELAYPQIRLNMAGAKAGQLIERLSCPEPDLCPHYRGYSVRGVSIAESPDWLKRRITAIGLRPINNVVDATNYILHETGQPLHAFDVRKIRGGEIVVRSARKGEAITTLDDKKRSLTPEQLVIADAEGPLVVAGVMGSVDAEVDESTTDIFLESAWFDPVSVRRTSKALVLSTDSSYRFERGVDPKGAEYAALRCLDLILELAGGELLGPPLVEGEPPLMKKEIEVAPEWIRQRIGFSIPDEEIAGYLTRLELRVAETETDEGELLYRVGIPSFRQDLYRPIDLVEEVIRMYGSDRIPEGKVRASVTLREDDPIPVYQRKATSVLIGQGFQETVHYSLRDEAETQTWLAQEAADAFALENPLASDASHLRPSILPGLLDCLSLNQARHNDANRFFECGRIFRPLQGNVYEAFSVGFVMPQSGGDSWRDQNLPDYYSASGIVRDLLVQAGLSVENRDFREGPSTGIWQSGHAAVLGDLANGYIAECGLLDLALTRKADIEAPVVAGTVTFLPEFFETVRERRTYEPFSLFPPAIRDLAIVVDKAMPAGDVEHAVREVAAEEATEGIRVESVRVFDLYEGKGLPEGHKSVALRLVFRHLERTLKDKEVNGIFNALQSALDAREGMDVRR